MAQVHIPDNPREREQLQQPSRPQVQEQNTRTDRQMKRQFGITDLIIILAVIAAIAC